jgi:hypothetical protein
LTRETETGPWSLVDPAEGEKLDSTKTSSMNYALSNPMFDDVVSPDTGAEITGLDQPLVARLTTFEGFDYVVNVGNKTSDDKYYVSVLVEGGFERERTPPADESAEDKERLDREFGEKLTKLDEKLAREQARSRWVYLVSKWTVDPLLKTRADFLETKEDVTKTDPAEEPLEEDIDDLPLVPNLLE